MLKDKVEILSANDNSFPVEKSIAMASLPNGGSARVHEDECLPGKDSIYPLNGGKGGYYLHLVWYDKKGQVTSEVNLAAPKSVGPKEQLECPLSLPPFDYGSAVPMTSAITALNNDEVIVVSIYWPKQLSTRSGIRVMKIHRDGSYNNLLDDFQNSVSPARVYSYPQSYSLSVISLPIPNTFLVAGTKHSVHMDSNNNYVTPHNLNSFALYFDINGPQPYIEGWNVFSQSLKESLLSITPGKGSYYVTPISLAPTLWLAEALNLQDPNMLKAYFEFAYFNETVQAVMGYRNKPKSLSFFTSPSFQESISQKRIIIKTAQIDVGVATFWESSNHIFMHIITNPFDSGYTQQITVNSKEGQYNNNLAITVSNVDKSLVLLWQQCGVGEVNCTLYTQEYKNGKPQLPIPSWWSRLPPSPRRIEEEYSLYKMPIRWINSSYPYYLDKESCEYPKNFSLSSQNALVIANGGVNDIIVHWIDKKGDLHECYGEGVTSPLMISSPNLPATAEKKQWIAHIIILIGLTVLGIKASLYIAHILRNNVSHKKRASQVSLGKLNFVSENNGIKLSDIIKEPNEETPLLAQKEVITKSFSNSV